MTNKKRLQFDFAEKAVEQLDHLTERMSASSRAEVIRRSLELLDNLVKWKEQGGEIILRSKDGEEGRLLFLV